MVPSDNGTRQCWHSQHSVLRDRARFLSRIFFINPLRIEPSRPLSRNIIILPYLPNEDNIIPLQRYQPLIRDRCYID